MKVKFSSLKQVSPAVDDGVRVPYAAARRTFPKARWYLILILVLSPFVYLAVTSIWSELIVRAPGLVESKQTEVKAAKAGRIATLNATAGQTVKEGDVLISFSTGTESGQRQWLQAQMNALSSPASRADVSQTIAALADTVASAQRLVAQRAERLEKMEFLVRQGAATNAEINLARAQWLEADLTHKRARAEWIALREANAPSDSRNRQLAMAQLQNERSNLDQAQAELVVRAARAGTVISVAVRPGDFVEQGGSLLTIQEPGERFVTAYLDPKNASLAKVGAKVDVNYPDGFSRPSTIVAIEESARKIPALLKGPFSSQQMALVVIVAIPKDVGAQYQIHDLPVEIVLGPSAPSWWPF